ncbi:vesicle-associated protein-like [Strongylocentrotus purpuratus]|uniref:Uncharacterized protein n=1 Tax=Strongylocentrotus purpuratus TaxID=7668 RepID=A0A7M7PGN4_STRPU|nr:vesicle-associated protein-like [Strongylocentrotus purpuratus]
MPEAKVHSPKKGGFFAGIAKFFTGDSSDSDSDDETKKLKQEINLPKGNLSVESPGADVRGDVDANLDTSANSSGFPEGGANFNIGASGKGSPSKGKKGGRFKLPKLGKPKINGSTDAGVEVLNVPDASLDVDDVKAPSFGGGVGGHIGLGVKGGISGPDVIFGGGVGGDIGFAAKGGISGPDVDVSPPTIGGKGDIGGKGEVPDASLDVGGDVKAPRFGGGVGGDIGFGAKGGISGPDVDVSPPSFGGIGNIGGKGKIPDASLNVDDVNAPSFGGGGGGESGLGVNGGISGPDLNIGDDTNIRGLNVPDASVGIGGDVKAQVLAVVLVSVVVVQRVGFPALTLMFLLHRVVLMLVQMCQMQNLISAAKRTREVSTSDFQSSDFRHLGRVMPKQKAMFL